MTPSNHTSISWHCLLTTWNNVVYYKIIFFGTLLTLCLFTEEQGEADTHATQQDQEHKPNILKAQCSANPFPLADWRAPKMALLNPSKLTSLAGSATIGDTS